MNFSKLPLATELRKLETFSPHILEASLRGMNLNEIFRDFYRTNSPRFEGFRELCKAIADGNPSKSFDIQMTIVHNDFMTALMKIISGQLDEIGVSEESFIQACQGNNNPVQINLIQFLESQADFIRFGENMEDIFHQLFPSQIESTEKKHVRVLWDIENIGIPRRKGSAIDIITRLQSFLQSKNLFGRGIDCRFTAFFAPNNSSVPPKVIEELDKAAVELVWVSGKREDADRKLGFRISQEIQVLPALQTVFVIISSDQDFRHHFQLLRNSGYTVIVIHDAKSDHWVNVMELHATEAYRWCDIIPQKQHKIRKSSNVENVQDTKEKSPNNNEEEVKSSSCLHSETLIALPNQVQETVTDTDWLTGICTTWKTSYGFCQVITGSVEYLKKDIFVHKSILPKECHGNLSKGDQVNLKAILKDKGLQATEIILLPIQHNSISS